MYDFHLFENLMIHADAGTVVNVTTNGTTGPVNAYTGVHDPSETNRYSMSSTMKTYYDTELLENARPQLKFAQLGKQQRLPKQHGKSVEWRKWNTFDRAMKPLVEGVIPTGQKFGQTSTRAEIQQHGDYTTVSDVLDMHAIDDVILGATDEMGAAAGWTADTLVRDELCTGTSVIYADTLDANGVPSSTPTGRYGLAANNNRLTPDVVNKAYTFLKKQKAPFYEGNKYVAVIHPSVTYDLRSHPDWVEAHKYAATTEIFEGEIGELHGVRFVESTEAPVFKGDPLNGNTAEYLTYSAYSGSASDASATAGSPSPYRITVSETPSAELVGRKIMVYDASATAMTETLEIVGVTPTSKYVYVDRAPSTTLASNDLFYPGEGGADATNGAFAVYATLFFGKDAFAVVDPEGMGMEMIIKPASQIGGPLDQFSTIGYKFETATKILYQNRMVRVESCSAYSLTDDAN